MEVLAPARINRLHACGNSHAAVLGHLGPLTVHAVTVAQRCVPKNLYPSAIYASCCGPSRLAWLVI